MIVSLLAACASDGGVKAYNEPPVVSIQNPTNGTTVEEATLTTFAGTVKDNATASEDLVVLWQSDIDGLLQEGVPADADGVTILATAALSIGNHVITLTAADEQGEQNYSTIQIGVLDVPDNPELQIVHPSGGEYANEGDDFRFVVKVSDEQDAPQDLQVTMRSDLDGPVCDLIVDEAGVGECIDALSGGDHTLIFTVTDLDGYQAVDDWTFVVTPRTEIDDDGDGLSEVNGDCNDADIYSYPGAVELEDGADNDCDGTVDEGTFAYDDDGDGTSENDGDCNDSTIDIGPHATEACNGVDDDCDLAADGRDSVGCFDYYYDYDADGYGSNSVSPRCLCVVEEYYTSAYDTDCYDYNASASPAASIYSTSHRGDSSYDWNCDGSETKYWTSSGSCGSWPGCSASAGWDGSAKSCGSSGKYIESCSVDWFSCEENTSDYTQKCL